MSDKSLMGVMSRKESNNTSNGLLIGLLALGLILVISFTITKPVETAHGTAMEDQCVKNYDKSMDPDNIASSVRDKCKTIILQAFQGDDTSIKKLKKIGIDVKPDVKTIQTYTEDELYLQCMDKTIKRVKNGRGTAEEISGGKCEELVSKALSGNKASIKSLKALGINISSDDKSPITHSQKNAETQNKTNIEQSEKPIDLIFTKCFQNNYNPNKYPLTPKFDSQRIIDEKDTKAFCENLISQAKGKDAASIEKLEKMNVTKKELGISRYSNNFDVNVTGGKYLCDGCTGSSRASTRDFYNPIIQGYSPRELPLPPINPKLQEKMIKANEDNRAKIKESAEKFGLKLPKPNIDLKILEGKQRWLDPSIYPRAIPIPPKK